MNPVLAALLDLGLFLAMVVILDLEYPRMGLIHLDAFDRVLVEVRQSMK